MDIRKLEAMLKSFSRGTYKGIVPVDFAGYPLDLEEFRKLADEYGLWIIEDAGIACKYGAKVPFMRSAEMSNDYAGTDDVIFEVLRKYKEQGREFETVCCIYSTAPFVTPERLREAYGKMNSEIDSVFTCVAYSYPIQRSLHIVDGKLVWFILNTKMHVPKI